MQNKSDVQLLCEYAAQRSESAFAEVVTRHTDLVYSAALRQTGSPELAHEITQSVFTDLARKARALTGTLSAAASLAGWLFRGTRFAGLKLLRDNHRRQTRERQFMEHFNPASETAPDWERVAPVLDEAMAELGDADHEAVVLRYFKNQDFHAVGLALGVSDVAAQKRVSRAVERLREFFAKRGVTVGAQGLVVVISTNAVQAAPAGLAGTLSTAAVLAGTTLTTTATATATATIGKVIAMAMMQKTLIALALLALLGAATYTAYFAARPRNESVQVNAGPLPAERMYQGKTLSQWVAELFSTNQPLREAAHEAFRAMGDYASPAIPALAAVLHSSRNQNAAGWALVFVGTNSLPTLIDALTNGNRITRMEVAGAIGWMQDRAEAAVPALVECMRHEDPFVRCNAIGSLQSFTRPPDLAVPVLIVCLTDTDTNVRVAAATVLRNYGSAATSAVPALARVAKEDVDALVRTRAAESLRVISPERAKTEGL